MYLLFLHELMTSFFFLIGINDKVLTIKKGPKCDSVYFLLNIGSASFIFHLFIGFEFHFYFS